MSVIIFMWSQGFLSQTSSAVGGQQGSQNRAAQSSISIEMATFTTTAGTPSITLIVRNVGAVSVTLGSISITGSSSNSAFQGSILGLVTAQGVLTTPLTASQGSWTSSSNGLNNIPKGTAVTILTSATGATGGSGTGTQISSGDLMNVKVTTSVGTFAQSQFLVP